MNQTFLTLQTLGLEVKRHRGSKGLRAAANEIGVSAATLSRVESGKQPDLDTFSKICKWLNLNPSNILGFENIDSPSTSVSSYSSAHFRASRELKPETAKHLADLILSTEKYLSELSSA